MALTDRPSPLRPIAASSAGAVDPLSEAMLRVAAGDQTAFADVFQRTSAKLFGLCLRITADTA